MAVSFALMAAESARKPVWLVDLDLKRNSPVQYVRARAVCAMPSAASASPTRPRSRRQPFFTIEPDDPEASAGLGLFTAHRVGREPA